MYISSVRADNNNIYTLVIHDGALIIVTLSIYNYIT